MNRFNKGFYAVVIPCIAVMFVGVYVVFNIIFVEPEMEIEVTQVDSICEPAEYYDKHFGYCVPNKLYLTYFNSKGFIEHDTKQIVGRVVQVETGNHITIESGERYKIHNEISDIWIDDIVRLHDIKFEPEECLLTGMHFSNSTFYKTKDYPYLNDKVNYTLISFDEIKEKIIAYNEFNRQQPYFYFTDKEDEVNCSQAGYWEVEKLE
jgi:hypothetical protein